MGKKFDLTQPKDLDAFFDILSPHIQSIVYAPVSAEIVFFDSKGKILGRLPNTTFNLIWGKCGEYSRPYDKAKLIGCLCWLWQDDIRGQPSIGIIERIDKVTGGYVDHKGTVWLHCAPIKDDEIKLYNED